MLNNRASMSEHASLKLNVAPLVAVRLSRQVSGYGSVTMNRPRTPEVPTSPKVNRDDFMAGLER